MTFHIPFSSVPHLCHLCHLRIRIASSQVVFPQTPIFNGSGGEATTTVQNGSGDADLLLVSTVYFKRLFGCDRKTQKR